MLKLKCDKCGSENIGRRTDRRGLYEAYCENCGAFIKKLSMAELGESFEEELQEKDAEILRRGAEIMTLKIDLGKNGPEDRPLCKWCTERYGYQFGLSWIPLDDIKFCPQCGRRLQESDRKY